MLCSLLHRIIHSIYVLSAEVITVISIDMVWEANRSFHSSIGLLFRLNGSHLKEHPWTIVNGTKDPPRGAIILLTPSGLRSFGRLLCRSSVKDLSSRFYCCLPIPLRLARLSQLNPFLRLIERRLCRR